MKHIPGLDGLRGMMALWVVIGHTLGAFPALFGAVPNSLYNDVPVQVFIILSGFVIFAMLDYGCESYGRYLTGRAFRLFPVYLVVLVLSTLTLSFAENVLQTAPVGIATEGRIQIIEIAKSNLLWHFLVHLPLIQGIFPLSISPSAPVTIVGQAWSLTLEWQFYIVAPMLFTMTQKLMDAKIAVLAILIVIGCWIISPIMHPAFLGNGLPLFSIGFASFFAFKRRAFEAEKNRRYAAFISIMLLSGLLLHEILAAIAIWFFALFAVTSSKEESWFGVLGRFLSSKPATYIGSLSYPLYLIHMQVFFCCLWVTNHVALSGEVRLIVLPLLAVGASIAASDLLHRTVEVPCQKLGKRILMATPRPA